MSNRKTLESILDRGANNFDLIRLTAASLVVYGHCIGQKNDLLFKATNGLEYSGSIAVYTFFLLSGILITASFERSSSALNFIAMRIARIWPGVIFNALASIAIIGIFFTTMTPLRTFLLAPKTLSFMAHNMTLLAGIQFDLPGAFPRSYAQGAVNWPWWTLPLEISCYGLILVLGAMRLLASKWLTTVAVGIVLLGFLAICMHAPEYASTWRMAFQKPGGYSFYPIPFFLLGIVAFKFRKSIVLDWRLGIALLVLYILAHATVAAPIIFYAMLAYGVLCLSSARPLAHLRPRSDYSYGIYIYGFMSQQIVFSLLPQRLFKPAPLLIGTYALSLFFAAISWHLIERPALRITRRWASTSRLTSQTSPSSTPNDNSAIRQATSVN